MRRIGPWLAALVAMVAVSLMLMGGFASANSGSSTSGSTTTTTTERAGNRVLRVQTQEDGTGLEQGTGRRPCPKRDGGSGEGNGTSPSPSSGETNTSV